MKNSYLEPNGVDNLNTKLIPRAQRDRQPKHSTHTSSSTGSTIFVRSSGTSASNLSLIVDTNPLASLTVSPCAPQCDTDLAMGEDDRDQLERLCPQAQEMRTASTHRPSVPAKRRESMEIAGLRAKQMGDHHGERRCACAGTASLVCTDFSGSQTWPCLLFRPI